MIRGGNGKLKGRRNHRRSFRGMDWRFYTRLWFVDETPKMVQLADIQDALKW